MNYQKIYDSLIEKRKKNILCKDVYGENHHIIPRCMGGSDDYNNLVRLTAKEHYIAHALLYKIHKTSKLAHAWFMMLRCDPNQKRFYTAKQYEMAKNAHVNSLKESMKGENNPFFGKTHTLETRKKLSENMMGIDRRSPEQIQDWIENIAKKPKSKEHRKKIGRENMIMLKNVNTGEIIRVKKDDPKAFSPDWVNPKKGVPEKKYKCDHCGILTNKGNLNRWHNENCKKRSLTI